MALCLSKKLFVFAFAAGTMFFNATDTFGAHYSSRVWQTEEGLPNDSVQSIAQTPDGFLWVGTRDGLCRFDGAHFTVFDKTVAPELKARWFSVLRVTKDGALWIGTDGKGLFRIEGTNISHFSTATGLGSDSVRNIFEARDHSIWIGTGAGLSKLKGTSISNLTTTNGLLQEVVRAVCEQADGTMWVATGNGLNCLKNGVVTASYRNDVKDDRSLIHNSIRCLLVDNTDTLWIGSNGGLSRFENGQFQNQSETLLDPTVSALFQDSEGVIWVGTLGGLHKLIGGRAVAVTADDGGIFDAIYSITEDAEGDLWIGTNVGLYRLKKRRFNALTKQDGLNHNTTVSVLADGGNRLWIGTWGGALAQVDGEKVNIRAASQVLPFYFVLGLAKSRSGHLWLGTDYDEGLYRFDPDGGGVTRWGKEHGFTDASISVLCEDHEGTIWIGTRTALIRRKADNFQRFTTKDGLPANAIHAIYEDSNGTLWVGTSQGLGARVNGVFHPVNLQLEHVAVTALHGDDRGNLWIGTKDAGLCRINRGRMTSYTTAAGLFSDDIFEILESDGFLWMTCSRGIFRVNKAEFDRLDTGALGSLHCISYDKSDGMISVDCKGVAKPAACKTSDGRLWFATGKGLAVTESQLSINNRRPRVFVEKILANKTALLKPTFATSTGSSPISIPAGGGDLEIWYTAVSLQAPEKNRFRYKLEGVDADWVDAGTLRVAYYNHLDPGNYTFVMTGCNNDGVWADTPARIGLRLLPYYWQTSWFKIAIGLGCLLAFVAICRFRANRMRELEKLRVRIAGDLHDEVGSSLWSIALLSRMLQKSERLDIDGKQDASEINRMAVETANSIRDIVWFINPEYDEMEDLVLRMRDVAKTMLSGVEYRFDIQQENMSRKLPLDFRQNIFLLFKEVLVNVVKHSRAGCVSIRICDQGKDWEMTIQDNGIGFDVARQSSGTGLQNLRRRTEKLKGTLNIKSQPGSGTEISLTVPRP